MDLDGKGNTVHVDQQRTPADYPVRAPSPGHCFLCGSTTGTLVWQEPDHCARLCTCGIVFMDPMPAPQAADRTRELHSDGYYTCNANTRLDWVRRFHREGRLLEVGCGSGGFLALARDSGYSVHGVEPHTERASDARENYGLAVEQAFIEESKLPDGEYDVVFHVDLLSHLPDPVLALEAMSRRLRPGGHICFEVGIMAGFSPRWYRLTGASKHSYPYHIWLFSDRGLRMTLRRAGLEAVETRRFGLLASAGLLGAVQTLRPVLGRWSTHGPGTQQDRSLESSRTRKAYDRLQHLSRYRVGRWMPPVGPQTMFVAARSIP